MGRLDGESVNESGQISTTKKTITALSKLKPGDHIVAVLRETQQRQNWSQWLLSWFSSTSTSLSQSRSASSSSSRSRGASCSSHTSSSRAGQHMLVVRVIDENRVCVLRMTSNGIREEAVMLDARDVHVMDYECRYTAEEAIQHARDDEGKDSDDEMFVMRAKRFLLPP